MRGSKLVGGAIIFALVCMLGIFSIEEFRLAKSDSIFEVYEKAEDAININTATEEELKTLDGVGDAVAERIIKFRTEEHSFAAVEELMLVRGIGRELLERNINRITTE